VDIVRILEEAIESEKEAQTKYRQAAEEAEDAETRTIFKQLTEDEARHERALRERLKAIKLLRGTGA
jgi:rubrerythrin